MKRAYKVMALSAIAAIGSGALVYRSNFPMPLKKYTATALYMAVLDDEISRRELAEAALFALGPAVTAPRELLLVLLVVVQNKKGFLLAKSELTEGVFSDFKSELSPRVLRLTKKGIN